MLANWRPFCPSLNVLNIDELPPGIKTPDGIVEPGIMITAVRWICLLDGQMRRLVICQPPASWRPCRDTISWHGDGHRHAAQITSTEGVGPFHNQFRCSSQIQSLKPPKFSFGKLSDAVEFMMTEAIFEHLPNKAICHSVSGTVVWK